MNLRVKKSIFWAVLMSPLVFGICFLLGGNSALAAGPHGHGGGGLGQMNPGGMAQRGGFAGGHGMYGHHLGGGINWLGFLVFLVVVASVVYLLVKWLRKKSKASSMQQFIDSSFLSSQKPMMNQNASMLDQWEKSITLKKENE